jgi:hypothetical protein
VVIFQEYYLRGGKIDRKELLKLAKIKPDFEKKVTKKDKKVKKGKK